MRRKILDVPIENLEKAKMKQPMLEKLPQLAGEQSHQELQEYFVYCSEKYASDAARCFISNASLYYRK